MGCPAFPAVAGGRSRRTRRPHWIPVDLFVFVCILCVLKTKTRKPHWIPVHLFVSDKDKETILAPCESFCISDISMIRHLYFGACLMSWIRYLVRRLFSDGSPNSYQVNRTMLRLLQRDPILQQESLHKKNSILKPENFTLLVL